MPDLGLEALKCHTNNVTAVTVTYGKRLHMLLQTLDAVKKAGASSAIIVDNGSQDEVSVEVGQRYGSWAHVYDMEKNRGSAAGFKVGIEQAVAHGAELLILLDDDNIISGDGIAALTESWKRFISSGVQASEIIVHAVRKTYSASCESSRKELFHQPKAGSFLGFHILDVPYKLARRYLPWLLSEPDADLTVCMAPYGGMLFHKDVIGLIGLPDEDFFLYVDDYEFSYRLTKQHGKIAIVSKAVIQDIDTTWGSAKEKHYSHLFTGRLALDNKIKLFYAIRNLVYFERYVRPGRALTYIVNKRIFLVILFILSLKMQRVSQYHTIMTAIKDGERKILGIKNDLVLN